MIQSISSDRYSELKISSVPSSTAAKTSSADSELTVSSQVPKTDTIEISEQARQAMQQSKVAAANTEQSVQADATQSGAKTAQPSAKPAQQSNKSNAAVLNGMSSAEDIQTTGSTEQSPVLSTLTETQLDKLVKSGTITSSQKNAELARRAAAAAQQAVSDDSNKKSISKAQEQAVESYNQQAAYGIGAITESGSLLNIVA